MLYHKVIDIRTPDEWQDEAWLKFFPDESVELITWNNNPEAFIQEFSKYPAGAKVLLVCRSDSRTRELIKAVGDVQVDLAFQEGGYNQLKEAAGEHRSIERVEDIPENCTLLLGMSGCGPCGIMKDRIGDVAIFVDCSKTLEIARHFQAADMPTIIRIENGQEVKRWQGLTERSEILD